MATNIENLSPQIDLPKVEHEILSFWETQDIFHKSVAARNGAPTWTFYEGPPTANGKPGTHHIEARVFKDVFPRYQTMKGKQVVRKAGWDCHGLPVEIAVEKELGFNGKGDIENFGIAPFNEKCKISVQEHVGEFTDMTRRMGFWVDFDQAYWTMSSEYIESVWWSLKEIWKKGLLVQDYRVSPYCPRCGTGLSDHELSQGYETVVDPSVYVRFPATSGKVAELGASYLIWTTTPWTLVSNTAVAVHPEVNYVVLEIETDGDKERIVVAEDLAGKFSKEGKVLANFLGQELERETYSRPFDLVDIEEAHYIVLAEYVTTEDGTGLVHQAPAFGSDDYQTCKKYALPVVNPVLPNGQFEESIDLVGGMFFKDADKLLIKDLKSRSLMFKHEQFEHTYPHCWRCHTLLIYYAQPSWYIRTTQITDALKRENLATDWHPETIKTGRYGDWLNNNIDWALSRNRYWGTPLPIWRCTNKHEICVGSLSELSQITGKDCSTIDPHRPFVDEIVLKCEKCGENMARTPEVIDCWYDSGAMPFAQWGYPHKPGSKEKFEASYPANFICEAIDQTRGWFYTLMAIGTLVFDKSSYETVLCLGHILDKDGRKMSKHLGNVLEPIPLMDKHGADAVRWYMLAAGSPWSARRVGHDAISDVVRKTLLTYWNTVSFFTLYAKASNYSVSNEYFELSTMDKWIISELNELTVAVDQAYASFDSQEVGKLISDFVDDLSNWYVRRSRRKFWDGDFGALSTLYNCLKTLTLLMAPMVPFITEHVWQKLIRTAEPQSTLSVHLENFPIANVGIIDKELSSSVRLSRRLVELGRAARAESKIKIRQPLSRALVAANGWQKMPLEVRSHISDELNVLKIEELSSTSGDLVDISIKANFKSLGAKYGATVQEIAKALNSANARDLVSSIRSDGKILFSFGKGSAELTIEDLVITETPKEGWAVATHTGESVALDLELTPELIESGIVREIIRAVQEERKRKDLDVSDRIELTIGAKPEVMNAFLNNSKFILSEVLATGFNQTSQISQNDDLGLVIAVTKV